MQLLRNSVLLLTLSLSLSSYRSALTSASFRPWATHVCCLHGTAGLREALLEQGSDASAVSSTAELAAQAAAMPCSTPACRKAVTVTGHVHNCDLRAITTGTPLQVQPLLGRPGPVYGNPVVGVVGNGGQNMFCCRECVLLSGNDAFL